MSRWIRTARARAALGALVAAGCLATWLGASGSDSPEAREIKSQLWRQYRRIESLEVSYELNTTTDLKPDQLRALADFHTQLFLPSERWREAYQGDKRYRRQLQPERVNWLAPTDAHGLVPPELAGPNDLEPVRERQKAQKEQYDKAVARMKAVEARGAAPRRNDPNVRDLQERDVTRGFNGRSLWMQRPIKDKMDEFQTWPILPNAHWFGHSAYLAAVGFQADDPTGSGANKVLKAFRLAGWVEEHSYALEEKTELVDGSTCVVLKGSWNSLLKPSMVFGDLGDRIWLDRDHGLAVRKRELTKDGQVMERWENSDLREVEPGLWFPHRARHQRFAADIPAALKGKPALTVTMLVESVEVNKVVDALFDMPVPKKGDRVEDLRGLFKK